VGRQTVAAFRKGKKAAGKKAGALSGKDRQYLRRGKVKESLIEGAPEAETSGVAGGDMKRCPACNWRNPAGATACTKCKGKLRKTGDAKLPAVKESADRGPLAERSVGAFLRQGAR
jgi:ribosomal protein L40E